MAGTNNNSSSIFPKYDEDRMVVILKDGMSPSGCECFRNDIISRMNEYAEDGEDFSELQRDPKVTLENVELWKNIKSDIVGRVIRSNTGNSKVSGGELIFNFKNTFPSEDMPTNITYGKMEKPQNNEENAVIIAVLDTGVNSEVIPDEYLWKGTVGNPKSSDYKEYNGMNFLVEDLKPDGTSYGKYEIHDDHRDSHGTLVNAFIIEQFKAAGKSVKIMNLKTHNSGGIGNLFSTVAAIRFAMNNKAHIINASWGFYSDEVDEVLLPLKELITKYLAQKDILFVTAAGNAFPPDDELFLSRNQQRKGYEKDVRNLTDNRFFPAYFGKEIHDNIKNLLVVTTLSETKGGYKVSYNQNYSDEIVDLGVVADELVMGEEKNRFKIPLEVMDSKDSFSVFGSSFAAAIVTGKIGAHFSRSSLPKVDGADVKFVKSNIISNPVKPPLFKSDPNLFDRIIRGVYMEK